MKRKGEKTRNQIPQKTAVPGPKKDQKTEKISPMINNQPTA